MADKNISVACIGLGRMGAGIAHMEVIGEAFAFAENRNALAPFSEMLKTFYRAGRNM